METEHLNCWEFKECGREPNGKNVALFGACPVATDNRADGIHNGKNGGRCCWVFNSPDGKKNTSGCYTGIFTTCSECDFYRAVRTSSRLLVFL